MAQFWPKTTSGRIAMVGCWAVLLAFGYNQFSGISKQAVPAQPAATTSRATQPVAATPPTSRPTQPVAPVSVAQKVDPGEVDESIPHAFEMHDLKMALFGVKCQSIDPIVAKKVEAVLLPMMYRDAHPENAFPFADPEINDEAKKVEQEGINLAPASCGWWNGDDGKTEKDKLYNLARMYTP